MRLIDADAFCEQLNSAYEYTELGEVIEMLDNAPTVEPPEWQYEFAKKLFEKVRPQGEWLEDSGNIACSHCHTIWLYRRTDFCPNCGADMRGGRE